MRFLKYGTGLPPLCQDLKGYRLPLSSLVPLFANFDLRLSRALRRIRNCENFREERNSYARIRDHPYGVEQCK